MSKKNTGQSVSHQSMGFYQYIRHNGYGHMGNLKVFQLSVTNNPDSNGMYHANYGNSENTIWDTYAKTREKAIEQLGQMMVRDAGRYWEAKEQEWLNENSD